MTDNGIASALVELFIGIANGEEATIYYDLHKHNPVTVGKFMQSSLDYPIVLCIPANDPIIPLYSAETYDEFLAALKCIQNTVEYM